MNIIISEFVFSLGLASDDKGKETFLWLLWITDEWNEIVNARWFITITERTKSVRFQTVSYTFEIWIADVSC